jgi:hypothetical protein
MFVVRPDAAEFSPTESENFGRVGTFGSSVVHGAFAMPATVDSPKFDEIAGAGVADSVASALAIAGFWPQHRGFGYPSSAVWIRPVWSVSNADSVADPHMRPRKAAWSVWCRM